MGMAFEEKAWDDPSQSTLSLFHYIRCKVTYFIRQRQFTLYFTKSTWSQFHLIHSEDFLST